MGLRQRVWARKAKKALLSALYDIQSGHCAHCQAERGFTFDVILPDIAPAHHETVEWSWRISIYRQQFRIGNLQLLCRSCNSRKGNKRPENFKVSKSTKYARAAAGSSTR